MIDEKAVENIQTYGVYQNSGAGRNKVLFEDLGLNADKEAEYVIIAGCVQPEGMPHAFSAGKTRYWGSTVRAALLQLCPDVRSRQRFLVERDSSWS